MSEECIIKCNRNRVSQQSQYYIGGLNYKDFKNSSGARIWTHEPTSATVIPTIGWARIIASNLKKNFTQSKIEIQMAPEAMTDLINELEDL